MRVIAGRLTRREQVSTFWREGRAWIVIVRLVRAEGRDKGWLKVKRVMG